jgi:hypothetical protein
VHINVYSPTTPASMHVGHAFRPTSTVSPESDVDEGLRPCSHLFRLT